MATIQDLFTALRNADAAGNTEDAKRLAEIIHGLGFGEKQQAAEEAPKKEPGVGAYLKDIPKAVGRGAVGLGEAVGIGAAAALPEEYEEKARKGIESLAGGAKEYLAPSSQEVGESIPSKLASAVGSTIPFFAAAPFGIPGAIAAAGAGIAAGAGEARQAAEEKGATKEERRTATMLGAPVGFLDIIAPEIKPFKGLLTTAAMRGGVEGLTEAAQKIAQNLIAKGVYDPNQEITVGAGEEGAYGAGAGALASLIVDMTLGRRARGPKGEATKAEAPVQEVPPTVEPQAPAGGPLTPEQAQDVYAQLGQFQFDQQAYAQQMAEQRAAEEEQQRLAGQALAQDAARGIAGFGGPADINADLISAARADRAAEQQRLVDEQRLAEQQRQQQINEINNTTFSPDPFQNEIVRSRALADIGIAPQQQLQEATKPPSPDELVQEIPSGEPKKKFTKFEPPKNIPLTAEEQEYAKQIKTRLDEVDTKIKEAEKTSTDLFKTLEGKLKPDEVRAIFPEAARTYPKKSEMGKRVEKYRKLINTTGRGTDLSTLVSDGALDDYLPPQFRRKAVDEEGGVADESAAVQYINNLIASGNTRTHDEAQQLLTLQSEREQLQQELNEPKKRADINYELQQIAERKRRPDISIQDLIADAESRGIDTDAIGERIAMQMPQATQEQYLGELHNQISNEIAAKEGRVAGGESYMYSLNPDIGIGNINPADFADVKNAKQLLEKYMKVGTDPELRQLAKFLLQAKRLADIDVHFVKTGDVPGHPGVARRLSGNAMAVAHTDKTGSRVYYRADGDTGLNESTLVHEVMHSMTEAALERNSTLRNELKTLTKQMGIGLRDLAYLQNNENYKEFSKFWDYAVRQSPGEMIAYSLTSPSFRKMFEGMAANGRPYGMLSPSEIDNLRLRKEKPTRPGAKPTAPKEPTMWQRIVDFARRLFGIAPVHQKRFEEALANYHESLRQHEAAQDEYNKHLKEYESVSTLKSQLDNYLKQLIADTEAHGIAMPNGEAVSEAAFPYGNVPRNLMGFGKNRPQKGFEQEKYKHVQFVKVTFDNGEEHYDAIKGLNKSHALARARLNWPDAKIESASKEEVAKNDPSLIQEAGVISESLAKAGPVTPNQLGNDAMAILNSVGWDVAKPDPTRLEKLFDLKNAYNNDPAGVRAQAYGNVRRFFDKIETSVFSSDAALNNQIRRSIMDSSVGQEVKLGTLLNTSLSQTAHSDAVAAIFLREGNIRYNDEIHKWEGVKDDNNALNLSKALDKITDRVGLTKEQAELIAHKAFEARRIISMIQYNRDIDTQIAGLRYEAQMERAKGAPVKASALSEKAANLNSRKKFIHMSEEEIRAGMKMFELFPELKEVTDIWNGMRQNAMKVMVDTGLYTQEEAEMLLDNAEYVPFYRESQIEEGKGPKEFLRSLSVQAEKRFKGSAKPVNDIFDNMIRWTQYAINRGVRNRSAVALAETAQSLGLASEVKDAKDGDNVISVWKDGQRAFYDMQDPLFMDAFRGIESVSIPTIKFFSKFADILRKSVVLYPVFAVAQVPQDSFAAMFSSGLKAPYALSIPFRAVAEFARTLRGTSKAHEELKNVGAAGVRDFTSAVVRADAEIAAGLKQEKGVLAMLSRWMGNLAMAADNSVRQAVYTASIAQGLSRAEAMEKSFEIFNVRRRGSSAGLALAGQVIPFFNAYLAAQNAAYRTLTGVGTSPTERKAAFQTLLATTGSVMALSMIYAMMMGDDEDYIKKPTPTRDRLLMIPGMGGFGIPLRSDLFLLPKALAEHTYLLMTDNGFEDGAKFRESMKSILLNSIFSPTPVPQAVKPLAELVMNHDFFQNKPLVGVYQQKKELGRQFEDSTSELSKLLGKTGVISPIMADHFIRGMFGSYGGLVLYATNPILSAMSDTPRPDVSWRDAVATIPNMSAFVSKEYEPGLRKDFYALKEVTDRVANTVADLKGRSPYELADYLSNEENRQRYALSKPVTQIANKLTEIRRQVNLVSQLPEDKMDEEEKQARIKQLREQELQLLKNINIKALRQRAGM